MSQETPSETSSDPRSVKAGDQVSLRYTGTLDSGEVFDSNREEGAPALEFTAGAGQVIPGFDAAVMGMKVGENKKFRITADQAYGEKNPDLVQRIPREMFGDFPLQVGQQVALQDNQGRRLIATILDVADQEVTLDFNPKLAGEALTFDITIEDVRGK